MLLKQCKDLYWLLVGLYLQSLWIFNILCTRSQGCKGRDWFNCMAAHPLYELRLHFMSSAQVVSFEDNELILEAFKKMKDNQIGGLPVIGGETKRIIDNVSIWDIRFSLLKPELFANFKYNNLYKDPTCLLICTDYVYIFVVVELKGAYGEGLHKYG